MFEESSDEDLIRGTARGRIDMFEALVRRHADSLYGFLHRRTGDAGLAEDLLQEVLLRLHRHAGSFRGEGSARGWLFAVASNLAYSAVSLRVRRAGERGPGEGVAPETVPNGRPGPDACAKDGETGEAIRFAVSGLPDRQREVFLLRAYHDLPFDEIGTALGITPGAARAHMHHALAALRKKLRFLEP
jgi:RNA polymerase sigma-70 factor (ECF subfamily)